MKKKVYSLTIIGILIFIIYFLFTKSNNINEVVLFSSKLFLTNVFPSLFPMFLISSLLTNIGFPLFLGNCFSKIMTKVFKVKKEGAFVFFMSMITGFPSSAKYINDLIDNKLINNDNAEKILLFTFFGNPLFIVNTIGIIFLNNITYGYYILISQILGNIITGIIFRNYKIYINNERTTSFINNLKLLNNNINDSDIFETLLKSIKEILNSLLIVYGIITTFLIIICLFDLNYNNVLSVLLIGLFEMTSGLKYLSGLNISINIKVIISTIFISFGGLSIHTQIMNILKDKKIKYLPFLFSRIIHVIISVSILLIILFIYQ